jgi:SAM-dependent methyltransferase
VGREAWDDVPNSELENRRVFFAATVSMRSCGWQLGANKGLAKMTTNMAVGDYILGTGDDEIARLGLQHVVWLSRAHDAWQRAGFTVGQKLLDIGCGPGYASLDLAEIVGPCGVVLAVDRSRRFLEALDAAGRARGLLQLTVQEVDLEAGRLPQVEADGAWCRWILAFLKQPRHLLSQIAGALRPGGALAVHEYFDYRTWRMMPRSGEVEEFVCQVMETWRLDGGEPDVGLQLPELLASLGFEVRSVQAIVDIVSSSSLIWQWPKSFVQNGLRRLVDIRRIPVERARRIAEAFAECEANPNTRMVTPGVVEIIAVKR